MEPDKEQRGLAKAKSKSLEVVGRWKHNGFARVETLHSVVNGDMDVIGDGVRLFVILLQYMIIILIRQ